MSENEPHEGHPGDHEPFPPDVLTDEELATGQWIPLKEAVARAGVSDKALHARRRRNSVRGRPTGSKGEKPYGYHFHIDDLPPPRPAPSPPPPSQPPSPPSAPPDLLPVVKPTLQPDAANESSVSPTDQEWTRYLSQSRVVELEAALRQQVRSNELLQEALAVLRDELRDVLERADTQRSEERLAHHQRLDRVVNLLAQATGPD